MGNSPSYSRKATYAGRLYEADEDALTLELQQQLNSTQTTSLAESPDDELQSKTSQNHQLRMLLVPHSANAGPIAAHAYQYLTPLALRNIMTIVILHPHHCTEEFAHGKCLVSAARQCETPLGHLKVNDPLRNELLELSDRFVLSNQVIDETEHSAELQFPWLSHTLKLCHRMDDITILPIMVGDLKTTDEIDIGHQLAPILSRSTVLTILCSEFCQWGPQYKYTPWDQRLSISEFIQKIDTEAFSIIQQQDGAAFTAYRLNTDAPISGKHVIGIWLQSVRQQLHVEFVKYAQSHPVHTPNDSCVGLAAAVATRSE